MKKVYPLNKLWLSIGFSIISAGLSTTAFASAYQLDPYYNAVSTGDAGAGGAAIAKDASTAYANPAGLTHLPGQQLVASGIDVISDVRFSGRNIWGTTAAPSLFTERGSAQAGASRLLPGLYYSTPLLTERLRLGLSANGTFGLGTFYDNMAVVRYSATKSQLAVIDLSPTLAFKANDQFSLGAGPDFDWIDLTLKGMGGVPTSATPPTALDGLGKSTADGWGYGWHAGVLYQLRPTTRFGLAYHSQINTTITGKSSLSGGLVKDTYGILSNEISLDTFRVPLRLPPTTALSAYHELNCLWAIDGSIYYTQWDVLKGTQTLYNVASTPPNPAGSTGATAVDVTYGQHYRNTWMVSLGTSYQAAEQWLLRAGVGYDQSPVKSTERTVILPDNNRIIASIGAHYQPFKKVGFDFGYTHVFFQEASVDITTISGTQSSRSIGTFNNTNSNLLGAQVNWDIA